MPSSGVFCLLRVQQEPCTGELQSVFGAGGQELRPLSATGMR